MTGSLYSDQGSHFFYPPSWSASKPVTEQFGIDSGLPTPDAIYSNTRFHILDGQLPKFLRSILEQTN
jgi:hypothetical protein